MYRGQAYQEAAAGELEGGEDYGANMVAQWIYYGDTAETVASNDSVLVDGATVDEAGLHVVSAISKARAADLDEYSFGSGGADSPFSVCLWLYPTAWYSSQFVGTLFAKFDQYYREWALNFGSYGLPSLVGKLRASIFSSNNPGIYLEAVADNALPSLNAWYHIAMTYDGSKDASGLGIHVNGGQISVTPATGGTYSSMVNTDGQVGHGGRVSGTQYTAPGTYRDMRIYRQMLQTDQLAAIMAAHDPR